MTHTRGSSVFDNCWLEDVSFIYSVKRCFGTKADDAGAVEFEIRTARYEDVQIWVFSSQFFMDTTVTYESWAERMIAIKVAGNKILTILQSSEVVHGGCTSRDPELTVDYASKDSPEHYSSSERPPDPSVYELKAWLHGTVRANAEAALY
ncbi:hypothetical protein ST47_g3022 [Ascochyta rabiei]|uniref:Uncharacterized protein n=1 Tax=Didymella rabiei TaxID=5454 RepID=A0A163ISU2_DIDRA|nr:hypothetical protein ST47_g3022 [Ascochyta rabiei]